MFPTLDFFCPKSNYLMFRFYAPETAFYDKSFKLEDVKLVQ